MYISMSAFLSNMIGTEIERFKCLEGRGGLEHEMLLLKDKLKHIKFFSVYLKKNLFGLGDHR